MRENLRASNGLPISMRLLCEAHRVVLDGARGAGKQPSELRPSQNWVGGTRPGNAVFVPPPAEQVTGLLSDMEHFVHDDASSLPPLVRIALVHAQFETIHPFLDGNGRVGRLLIAALFENWQLLPEPLMYLSGYLKQHQAEYCRRLAIIRTEGDWEAWVTFFLEAVVTAANDAERSIIAIASLVAADRKRALASLKAGPARYQLRKERSVKACALEVVPDRLATDRSLPRGLPQGVSGSGMTLACGTGADRWPTAGIDRGSPPLGPQLTA